MKTIVNFVGKHIVLILAILTVGLFASAHTISTLTPQEAGGSSAVDASGDASADLDLNGFKVFDSTQALDLGTACTPAHGGVTGDVCIGGSGELEVQGATWLDGVTTMGADLDMNFNFMDNIDDSYGGHETTDTPVTIASITGRQPWSNSGASGANRDGGLLAISAGSALIYITVTRTQADAASDTVNLQWKSPKQTLTHTLTEGVDFDCSAAAIDTCVTNITTAINAATDSDANQTIIGGPTITANYYWKAVADLANDIVEIYGYGDGYTYGVTCGNEGGGSGPMCTATTNTPTVGDIWLGASRVWLNDDNTGFVTNGAGVLIQAAGNTAVNFVSTFWAAALPLDMQANHIYNNTGFLELGANVAASGHGLGTSDVVFAADAEFDGVIYGDAGAVITNVTHTTGSSMQDNVNLNFGSSNDAICRFSTTQTNDALACYVDTTSFTMILSEVGDIAIDFAAPVNVNPTLRFQGADSATPLDFLEVYHDQTDAVLEVGNGDLKVIASTEVGKGESTFIRTKSESVTFAPNPGDASKVTTGSIKPANVFLLGISTRVTTAGTNCTGYDVGIGGGDTDLYGSIGTVTQGTTSDNSDATADPTGWQSAAGEVTITATGGQCFDMVVYIVSHYLDIGAPTAN